MLERMLPSGIYFWLKDHKNDLMPIVLLRRKIIGFFETIKVNKHIRSFARHGDYFLQEVEIETQNRCNGMCSFCPVNANEPQRPYAKMPDALFRKIIFELSDMKYDGFISYYSNNEPFLDDRIIDFIEFGKEHLPNAIHCIYTNGTLLNLDTLLRITRSLDRIIIDNYNDALEVNDSLMEIYNYLSDHDELREKVSFSFRLQNEILFSRGGQAPNKGKVKPHKQKCILPFRQLIIRPTGEVSLCCNDALGKYTLGDLKTSSIVEIWNSSLYQDIRMRMAKTGRKGLMLCDSCDSTFSLQRK